MALSDQILQTHAMHERKWSEDVALRENTEDHLILKRFPSPKHQKICFRNVAMISAEWVLISVGRSPLPCALMFFRPVVMLAISSILWVSLQQQTWTVRSRRSCWVGGTGNVSVIVFCSHHATSLCHCGREEFQCFHSDA